MEWPDSQNPITPRTLPLPRARVGAALLIFGSSNHRGILILLVVDVSRSARNASIPLTMQCMGLTHQRFFCIILINWTFWEIFSNF
jgi:hypothetical protein